MSPVCVLFQIHPQSTSGPEFLSQINYTQNMKINIGYIQKCGNVPGGSGLPKKSYFYKIHRKVSFYDIWV